jgi:hypothetical protein
MEVLAILTMDPEESMYNDTGCCNMWSRLPRFLATVDDNGDNNPPFSDDENIMLYLQIKLLLTLISLIIGYNHPPSSIWSAALASTTHIVPLQPP